MVLSIVKKIVLFILKKIVESILKEIIVCILGKIPVCTFSGVASRKPPRGNQWQCQLSCCDRQLLRARICLNLIQFLSAFTVQMISQILSPVVFKFKSKLFKLYSQLSGAQASKGILSQVVSGSFLKTVFGTVAHSFTGLLEHTCKFHF